VLFSARPEAIVHAPLRDLRTEVLSEKPEAEDSEPVRDLKSEDLSAKLEAKDSEPLKALVIPLVSEAVRESEPLRGLNSELRLATPELRFQVAVRGVEQERGLELQVNCPEFTLATMLPIVSVIEAASALKIEVFSTKLETELSEPLSDLNIEVILAKAETEVSDPLGL